MSVAGLLISSLIVVVVGLWVFIPLLRQPDAGANMSEAASFIAQQRERLVILYERSLRNINDLDEDFNLGKLDQDEYARDREALVQRGIAALQGLERLDKREPIIVNDETDSALTASALDDQLEDFIRQSAALMNLREQQNLTERTIQE